MQSKTNLTQADIWTVHHGEVEYEHRVALPPVPTITTEEIAALMAGMDEKKV